MALNLTQPLVRSHLTPDGLAMREREVRDAKRRAIPLGDRSIDPGVIPNDPSDADGPDDGRRLGVTGTSATGGPISQATHPTPDPTGR